MIFHITTSTAALSGKISFNYGEGSDYRNRKASTIEAVISIKDGDDVYTIARGVSKMVDDKNDPDFGRELAIYRALESIAPVGVKQDVKIAVGNKIIQLPGRNFRSIIWNAWRMRRGTMHEIVPVQDSTRKAWRDYRAWVREHGRGQSHQLTQTA